MAYIDVLPLIEMKTYLRIDDTQSDTDAEITSMINSALRHIERVTHIMVYARDKDYLVNNGCVRVYDYPINSLVAPATATTELKATYTNYTVDSSLDNITLNVGHVLPADVPSDIIDVAKVMVKVMFYEQETNQSFKELLPGWAKEYLDTNRRFIF